jgi:threonine/homoserine/homoserine lactone efflux protein
VFSILLAGLGMGLFMSISVGPTIFAILRYSLQSGWKAGMSFVLGVSISDILYVALANTASSQLSQLLKHMTFIGYAGAGLFIIMGITALFKKVKVNRHAADDANVPGRQYTRIVASGFLMNSLNPGVIITWLSAVAAIATFNNNERITFFSACLLLILGFDLLKVLLAQRIRKHLTPRTILYLNRISALCIVGMGIFMFIKTYLGIKIGGM